MIAVDTNVLVYAHRGEFSQHGRARGLLAELADGDALWAIPVFCLGEFLRVVTHPSILKPPTRTAEAVRAIEALLHSPSLRLLVPGERYQRLRTGIVAFEAHVRRMDPRFKLGQDERPAVLGELLSHCEDPALEHWMRRMNTGRA